MNIRPLLKRGIQAALIPASMLLTSSILSAASITLSNPPLTVTPGGNYQVTATYDTNVDSIVNIKLYDSSWDPVDGDWKAVASSPGSQTVTIDIPSNTPLANNYHWQAVLSTATWSPLAEDTVYSVSVAATQVASISMDAPTTVIAGNTYTVSTDYFSPEGGIVQAQFFKPTWGTPVLSDMTSVGSGNGEEDFTFTVPTSTTPGGGYIWQSKLVDNSWQNGVTTRQYDVTVQAPQSSGEWLPQPPASKQWVLDNYLSSEFSGSGEVEGWYPMLGWGPHEFFPGGSHYTGEKGLVNANGAPQFFSTETGNHWLNGQGQLVIRARVDKAAEQNANGYKVETAYLQTGFPASWIPEEEREQPELNVNWEGRFVSPQAGPLYISTRVRTDQLQGWSTWFAFWLHSQTRAYNNTPSDGTEIDVVEIVKSEPDWAQKSFNTANHWTDTGGSQSQMFEKGRTAPNLHLNSLTYVDVDDSNYHIWSVEWSDTLIKCYVDGQKYYEFDNHIPTDPVDMMMMLTIEFAEVDGAWWANKGDGRIEGPSVDDPNNNKTMREMSRVLIDYVRVYRAQ